MEINGAGAAALDTSKSAGSFAKLTDNFDTFLNLLTAQLRNQNPLDPMDSSQFTNQLVQFSSVEQAIATNKNLEKLISLSTTGQLNSAVGFLGHDVKARGTTAALKGGKAEWEYQNDLLMKSVNILVSDENKKIVFVAEGSLEPGTQKFVWDGKDNSGAPLPDGNYSIAVSATGTDGKAITPVTFVSGRVSGVQTVDGEPRLVVNGSQIPLTDVRSILDGNSQDASL